MNSKSENAVQNTNTVSTYEERSQAHSPVVISRRRLLRAGLSGIPILLTMNGIAPGQDGIKTVASAASALNYDREGTYDRFSRYANSDNLVLSNNNGFIYDQYGNLVKNASVQAYPSNFTGFLTLKNTEDENDTITVELLNQSIGFFCSYTHKSGRQYTDLTISPKYENVASSALETYAVNTANITKFLKFTYKDGTEISSPTINTDTVIEYSCSLDPVNGYDDNGGTKSFYELVESGNAFSVKFSNISVTYNNHTYTSDGFITADFTFSDNGYQDDNFDDP